MSLMVSGMRSPCSWGITITNWPGFPLSDIHGAWISIRYISWLLSSRLLIISYILKN